MNSFVSIKSKILTAFLTVVVLNIILIGLLGFHLNYIRLKAVNIIPETQDMQMHEQFGTRLELLVQHLDKIDVEGYTEYRRMAVDDATELIKTAKLIFSQEEKEGDIKPEYRDFLATSQNLFTQIERAVVVKPEKETAAIVNSRNISIYQGIEILRQYNRKVSDDTVKQIISNVNTQVQTIFWVLIFFIVCGTLVNLFGLFILTYLIRYIVTPLKNLLDAVVDVGAGNLNKRIDFTSNDELGELAKAFNAMADQIDNSQKTLEDKVDVRTQELQNKIEEMEKFNKLTVNRELRMAELKAENDKLKDKSK
jgi:methyl-accepting chemotaxis protein